MFLYKLIENDELICALECAKENNDKEAVNAVLSGLFDFGRTYGFTGNLWKLYLTYIVCNDENAYSLSCEVKDPGEDSLSETAKLDFEKLIALFAEDFSFIKDEEDKKAYELTVNFACSNSHLHMLSHRVRDEITALCEAIDKAKDSSEVEKLIRGFYAHFGVGKIGLHRAFRMNDSEIVPITNVSHVDFDELIGLDIQKKTLMENTEAFLEGKPANNVLLYGDAGTGKSTSIKAMMNRYYEQGLRVVEIYKHQFKNLNDLIAQIKNRRYKFVIVMDDLSFEEQETEYKYLKAVIEGGLEKKPDNVLIYATSNRRHLVKETFKDKGAVLDDDIHKNDTVQEKLSLAYRFGVQIYFPSPEKKEFEQIVIELGNRAGLNLSDQELLAKANAWELRGSGRSGRSARQLIDNLSQ